MKLIYSEDAVGDLVRLRAFIEEKDPTSADRTANELIGRIENLRIFPEIGHAVQQAPEPTAVRDMVFGKYIVRYASRDEAIIVLRIWHRFEER